MEKLKVGIIGCGRIFDLNILGYLDNIDVEILCLCDKKNKSAEQKIEQYKLGSTTKPYRDYKEMLDSEELDIVEILLPHHLHGEATVYAAQKQLKGISVQKPMANTIEECDKMINVCKKNNVKLKVYENFTFYPPIMKAKELIQEGVIGEVNSVHIKTLVAVKGGWKVPSSTWKWRFDSETCGGGLDSGSPCVFDDGFHKFWLALYFTEEKIEKIYAWIDRQLNLDVPAYIMWKYKPTENSESMSSHYGTIEFNIAPEMYLPSPYYSADEFISIVGTKGIMWINQATAGGNVMSDSEIFPPVVIFRDGKIESYSDMERDWKYGFINSTKHFIDVIKNGGEPILTGEEGKYTTQFALAALKSSVVGKEMNPDDIK